MRMTNKIMQNNSLYNINQNKILQDKLSTQMSTQKKLTRPSDDPVVAIRALRLRSSVSELTQYYKKNSPDADSWLKVTSDGLGTVTDILTNMSTNANKGANKDLKADDIEIIVTNMRSLSQEFYATGNLDYAGRYVFSGFRTNTPMQFTASDVSNKDEKIPSYSITEQLTLDAFDTVEHTFISDLSGLTENNMADGSHDAIETNIENVNIHRLRLAYDTVVGDNLEFAAYNATTKTSTYPLGTSIPSMDKDAAYQAVSDANKAGDSVAVLIEDTGEILMSDAAYADVEAAFNDDVEFRITYDKKDWQNGDLRPEHYFKCVSTDENGTVVEYNTDYLDKLYEDKTRQTIEYDVGYNQTIEINTTADEVFTHNLNRDMDDLESALYDLSNMEEIRKTIKMKLDSMEPSELGYDTVKDQYDAADKAYSYLRENMHDMLGKMISKTQGYLDATNVAVTDNGTRMSRLELITNRLMEQETTFKTLQSNNEDVDIAEVAVTLTSAQLTYDSSLMATSKIMQTTLMNYI